MIRFAKLAIALVAIAAIALTPLARAHADGGGQIEGGDIYRVQNVTKGSDFVDPASADPGDTLIYKVRIHNPGQECLTNVTVTALLPAGANQRNVSTVTVHADNATTNNVSDTATVNLSSAQKIAYTAGTTQLLDQNGAPIRTLPETLFTSGVNIGTVCVSEQNKRYVQFTAKVNTPPVTPPTPTTPPSTPPSTPASKPTALPNTGAGDVLGVFAGASAAGTAAHAIVTRRRR